MAAAGERPLPELDPLDHPGSTEVRFVADGEAMEAASTLVIVGHKADLRKAYTHAPHLAEGTKSLLDSFIDLLPEPRDAALVRETFLEIRIVVIVLPSRCSRHNSPAHPHALMESLTRLSLDYPVFVMAGVPSAAEASATACAIARSFPMYSRKSRTAVEDPAANNVCVHIHSSDRSPIDHVELQNLTHHVRVAAALVDAPASELHTDAFVAIAERLARDAGATSITTIQGTALRDRGFGGLWGVGKASEHLPALVVLEHVPEGVADDSPAVVMVGKGIVYDTGGLSIKDKFGMPGMKRDCGGACAILAAFLANAKRGGCGKRVVAVLCLAENSVGPAATRPDDILHMYSGRTVEVNNTDAEGRLVLADGVAYTVKHLNPAVIIDMATLTGAQGISTGKRHAALYCNDDELERLAVETGRSTGDLAHPLPYAPEFFQAEFASAVADMKNSVADRANAQSSCAGQFIGAHMGAFQDTGKWLHVDMAYPSFRGERATGFGVALLNGLLTSGEL